MTVPDTTATLEHVNERVSLADVQVKLVTDLETAFEAKRWLSKRDRIAIDTECTGLSMERDLVRTIQIGDDVASYVIPLEGGSPGDAISEPARVGWGGFAAEICHSFDGIIDMFNAPYDHGMIKKTLGVDIPRHRINDPRLMAHVLDARGRLGLKPLAKQYVDQHADLGQDILDEAMRAAAWTWKTVPVNFPPYLFYAGLDTILTTRLRQQLEPRVLAEAPRSYELELAVQWPCHDMERHGVRVDRGYTSDFATELSEYVRQAEEWVSQEYGIRAGSNEQVIDVLKGDGVELTKRTPSGAKLSLDKSVLQDVDHPLARAVLGRRQALHIMGYLASYLELSEHDGLIHPSINTVGGTNKNPFEPGGGGGGVRTGRMSCSDPNLQNVPIRTKEGARIRRAFIPGAYTPTELSTWVKCDADQIEARILAHLSNDPNMISAFTNDGDFFVNLAQQLFNEPDFTKADPRRQFVKNGVYAKIYGAQAERFALTAGSSLEAAYAFMHKFDSTFPGVAAWIAKTQALVTLRGHEEGEAYARSPLTGRKHVVELRKVYPIINYLIQGLAGEILKRKIVEADAAGLTPYMLFPVHDEVDFDVPTSELGDVLATLHDTMNDNNLLNVPITWSADTGPSWGECK